jgi:hypothetical protein
MRLPTLARQPCIGWYFSVTLAEERPEQLLQAVILGILCREQSTTGDLRGVQFAARPE